MSASKQLRAQRGVQLDEILVHRQTEVLADTSDRATGLFSTRLDSEQQRRAPGQETNTKDPVCVNDRTDR